MATPECFINTLFTGLLLQDADTHAVFAKFLGFFPSLEQRKVVDLILKLLTDSYLVNVDNNATLADSPIMSAASDIVKFIIGNDEIRKNSLVSWLTSGSGAGIGEGCAIRRVVVSVFAEDKEFMATILERSLNQFGDQLYIKHAPILQQDGNFP